MKRTLTVLPIVTLLAILFCAPWPAAAGTEEEGEDMLVVRYAFLLGGREVGSAPTSAGVLSPQELHAFLLDWDPEADSEEVRQVFALNDIGELARQASQLPLAGGTVTGTYAYGDSRYDVGMRIRRVEAVAAPGEVITISAEIKRDGKLLSGPKIHVPLGERSILTTRNGPETPFLFLVVEVDRATPKELWLRGLRQSWSKGYLLVDGEEVIAPVAIEKTPPLYTEVARKAGQQGKVILRLLIDDEGTVEDVEVIEGQPYGLTEQAVEATRTWRFKPALRDGEPVAVIYIITVNFRLGDKKDDA